MIVCLKHRIRSLRNNDNAFLPGLSSFVSGYNFILKNKRINYYHFLILGSNSPHHMIPG